MKRSGSGSDIDDGSEDSLHEMELAKLQRAYRVMQNDYRAYKEETKRLITKQDMLIEQLEGERQELHTVMSKMDTTQNKGKDADNARQLNTLAKEEKDFQQLITDERSTIKSLDEKILDMERKIVEQRKSMGGTHNSTAKTIAIQKKKTVLENRLDKAITHFNRQLAINRQLRDDIDHLRQERGVFESLYKRLSHELDGSKQEMTEVIHTSTQALEQRDEAQGKIVALKERIDKDRQQHDSELKDLLRTISHDNKVKGFMGVKASDRMEYKVEEAAKKKKGDEKGMDADHSAIRTYETAFKQIQEVTGQNDINIIVDNFIRTEEENFALFNYVNELNSEVEGLCEEVCLVQRDIDNFQMEDLETDAQHSDIMNSMEDKFETIASSTNRSETRLREINKTLDQLRSGIESLFGRINCDPRPIRQMLGGDAGINNKNIMVYLGQIEHKTVEMLHALQFNKLKRSQIEGGPPPQMDTLVPKPTFHPGLHVMPPASADDDELSEGEAEDAELRPLSEDELRERVMKTVEKRILYGHTAPAGAQKATQSTKKDGRKKKQATRS